jgi:flagellar hook-associated protein 3 FlgL
MTISSIGDLAMSFQMRRDTAQVRAQLSRHTQELSSGVTLDIATHLRGDFTRLSSIENDLVKLDGFRVVTEEHRLHVTTQQSVIQKLRDLGSLSATFLSLPEVINSATIASAGAEALGSFEAAVQGLNTQAGGRTAFSGVGVHQPAIAPADTVLTEIETAIATAGATTAADIAVVVTDWFAPGGGYDTLGYIGDIASSVPVRLSDTETAPPPVTAEDGAIRDHLANLALGALVGRNNLTIGQDEVRQLIRLTGEALLSSSEGLVSLQARIGQSENQVERASIEISVQTDALQLARAELIEVDPYESATALQRAEVQLQTMYTLTSRLSRLSLVEYL